MGIFDSTGIRRPEEKRWGADVFTIPYPEGWEPGVRVKDRSGNNGTIANFKNIQRSMSKYCGEFKFPSRHADELPIVFDYDKAGFYWFEPKFLEIITEG